MSLGGWPPVSQKAPHTPPWLCHGAVLVLGPLLPGGHVFTQEQPEEGRDRRHLWGHRPYLCSEDNSLPDLSRSPAAPHLHLGSRGPCPPRTRDCGGSGQVLGVLEGGDVALMGAASQGWGGSRMG